jgi:hypothetical protein
MSLATIAPELSKIIDEQEARTLADDVVAVAEPTLERDLSSLGPAARQLFKQWLRWRLSRFVPDPFDKIARLSPSEVADRLRLHPDVVMNAIDELRRIREEISSRGEDAFQ